MRRPSVRDVRTRLLVVVLAALALALAAATAGFNALLSRTSDRDANALLRQRADSERALVQVSNGKLRVTEHSDDRQADARIWIFAGGAQIEGPRARPESSQAARSLASGRSRYLSLGSTDERFVSLPVLQNGRRYGTIVAAISLAPYEQTARVGLVASIAFASTLLLLVGATVWWLLRSALRPVAQMTEQVSTWSETEPGSRFRLGEPHDELTRLGWTLDRLLDRIAASLRHERLLSAELSHELRMPLAKLRAEAELALRRPRAPDEYVGALEQVIANADQIGRIVETLLSAAEHEAGQRGVADATSVAAAAAAACAPLAESRGIAVSLPRSSALRVGVDLAFAERVIHPVLDNACRYASSAVEIGVSQDNGSIVFSVRDDGPGVGPDEEAAIFEPAQRGAVGRSTGPGGGLGLALARRLARSATGDVEAASTDRGACFLVRLPAA